LNDLLVGDAWSMAEAVRERAVSARELAEASLELAAADRTGAVWLVTEERARREADRARWPVSRSAGRT
jgi:hypothetical protein